MSCANLRPDRKASASICFSAHSAKSAYAHSCVIIPPSGAPRIVILGLALSTGIAARPGRAQENRGSDHDDKTQPVSFQEFDARRSPFDLDQLLVRSLVISFASDE
jgi:hypothetical protein